VDTAELSNRAEEGDARLHEGDGRRGPVAKKRSGSPWLLLLVIVVAVALLVAVTVSVYPMGRSTPATPAHAAAAQQQQLAPALTVLPFGRASMGCFDPRSYLDGIVLCPGDLQGRWGYDGGVSQSQGLGSPSCRTFDAGSAVAWVDLDNGLTHVHEQLAQQPTSALALAAVDRLAKQGGTALCPNVTAQDLSKVVSVFLAQPSGASRVSAWSVPAGGRTWSLVFIAVDHWVIRLDVTLIGTSASAPPTGVLQQVVDQAVRRYQTGFAQQPSPTK
jgi:hypothetical protein